MQVVILLILGFNLLITNTLAVENKPALSNQEAEEIKDQDRTEDLVKQVSLLISSPM
jgi:hypothetical protein